MRLSLFGKKTVLIFLGVMLLASAGYPDSDPKTQLASVFQQGKNLYDQGRRSEAMQVWDSASGYWNADPSVKRAIEFFENKIQGKTQAVSVAPAPAPPSVDTPEETASSKNTQAQLTSEEPAEEAVPIDQPALEEAPEPEMPVAKDDPYVISSIYQKGKALYEQGRTEEAEKEWHKLDGRVGEHSGVRILIDSLKKSRSRR